MRIALALLLGAPLAFAAAPAAPTTYTACPSNEQLRHYQTLAAPALSPDGRWVVYVLRESTAEGAGSHLWLAATGGEGAARSAARGEPAGGGARQITFSPAADKIGESDPQWMPDGSAILFLAKRGEHRQIFRLPTAGGEAQALEIAIPGPGGASPRLSLDVASFHISPDGQWIALVARQPETPTEEKKIKDKDDPDVVDQDPHNRRVWLYSFASNQTVAVTPAGREARSTAWAPDSGQLAVITAPPGNAGDLSPHNRVSLVAIPSLAARPLEGMPPTVSALAFAPDGHSLAFLAQSEGDEPPGIEALFVLPLAGGAARDLTDASGFTVAGRAPMWTRDGAAFYIQGQRGTTTGLARVAVNDGAVRFYPAAMPVETDFATNQRQTGWTFIAQATDRPPQVEYTASLAQPFTQLSAANAAWPATGWVPAQPVHWSGPGGLRIEGLLFWPQPGHCNTAPPAGAKTPLIVAVHGGPTGAFVQSFSPFNQWLLAQGWALLEPNPRGSTGYGGRFAAANKNDLGGNDYADIMAGVDWALAQRPVEARRLGLFGYSYGGEMAGFVEGKTDRFAAIVSGAPVIDQYSEYGTEDDSWYDRWFFGEPWLRPQDAWRQSPLSYVDHARTPLLLLQGQRDVTDPLGQSQEMYRALRQMDVPVELVTYPREDHPSLARGLVGAPSPEPWHGFDARRRLAAWFRDHFAAR